MTSPNTFNLYVDDSVYNNDSKHCRLSQLLFGKMFFLGVEDITFSGFPFSSAADPFRPH